MKEIAMIKSETGRATIVFCGEGQDLELIQADGTREPIEANPESLRDAIPDGMGLVRLQSGLGPGIARRV